MFNILCKIYKNAQLFLGKKPKNNKNAQNATYVVSGNNKILYNLVNTLLNC